MSPSSSRTGHVEAVEASTRPVRPRWWFAAAAVVAVAAAVAAVLLITSLRVGNQDVQTKVFVVPDGAAGPTLTLPALAASTLGDADRATELFALNRGLDQPDGGQLEDPGQRLVPGWVLRLPPDATGPAVRTATDGRGPAQGEPGAAVSISLPVALASLGSVVLAVFTGLIVLRHEVRGGWQLVRVAVATVTAPWRRQRQRRARAEIAAQFFRSPLVAAQVQDDLASEPELVDPFLVRVGDDRLTVWLPPARTLGPGWTRDTATQWSKPHGHHTTGGERPGARHPVDETETCLVRVGVDSTGGTILVDLSYLDGTLSVSGDVVVSRDVLDTMLADLHRTRPRTPVVALPSAGFGTKVSQPPAGHDVREPPALGSRSYQPAAGQLSIIGAAPRHGVRGVVLATATARTGRASPPADAREQDPTSLLAVWSGTRAAGWTGLAQGEVAEAHWRWQAHADGTVHLAEFGLTVTVPASQPG